MNKLQLYITKSVNGYKVLFNINPSEEVTRHVRELRRVVDKVHYDATEKNIFYFVTTVDTGTFVTIIRTIPVNNVDHLAAWIYIPNELDIDGETLLRVVSTTARKVSGDRVTQDDVTQLRELFGREYPTDADAPDIAASNQRGGLAWRGYNGDTGVTLSDLFDKGLFQQDYLDYAGVLFLDGDLGLSADGADLTDVVLGEQAVVLPPERTPENFSPYVYGKALDHPMRATKGCNLAVVWKRAGFEDVVSEQVVTDETFTPEAPETSASRKSISAASFQIAAQTGSAPLEGCQILVNGIDVSHEPHSFTQAELVSASVVVTCEGCAPYTAHLDLAASTRALIRMQERTKVYCFEMPVKTAEIGAPVRFKIFSKKTITESPIDGYVALDNVLEGESRTNHLAYVRSNASMMQRLVYLGIGLLLGLGVALGLTRCGGSSESEAAPAAADSASSSATLSIASSSSAGTATGADAAQTQSSEVADNTKSTAVNNVAATADAIKYLDDNNTWSREAMEKFACLQGLFDDMNNFRLTNLTGAWASKLSASKNFGRIVTHANMGAGKKKRNLNGKYNKNDKDTKISVQGYLNRIDP